MPAMANSKSADMLKMRRTLMDSYNETVRSAPKVVARKITPCRHMSNVTNLYERSTVCMPYANSNATEPLAVSVSIVFPRCPPNALLTLSVVHFSFASTLVLLRYRTQKRYSLQDDRTPIQGSKREDSPDSTSFTLNRYGGKQYSGFSAARCVFAHAWVCEKNFTLSACPAAVHSLRGGGSSAPQRLCHSSQKKGRP